MPFFTPPLFECRNYLRRTKLLRRVIGITAIGFVGFLSLAADVSAQPAAPYSGVRLQSDAKAIQIDQPSLYPETIEANQVTGKFLVSSIRQGNVYEVGLDGTSREIIHDNRLTSILGIVVDAHSSRLLVTNSDIGAGDRHSLKGTKKEAGVGIYDLASGRALHYVDLTPLLPEGEHLINGITVDLEGNAYVTDSFSPVIFKIDKSGTPSVFLRDDEFKGVGISLNGIVYHPSGFLLVVKKNTGALYRVPLSNPRQFSRIVIQKEFVGGDGLLLTADKRLLLISNKTPTATSNTIFQIKSEDDWKTAEVKDSLALDNSYPTSCTAINGKVYLLESHLDEWISADDHARMAIVAQGRLAQIREIGVLTP